MNPYPNLKVLNRVSGGGAGGGAGRWGRRWVVVGLCFVAFMLCNMDRVNMSIAMPAHEQAIWLGQRTIGLVQSSFFWCALKALDLRVSHFPISNYFRRLSVTFGLMQSIHIAGAAAWNPCSPTLSSCHSRQGASTRGQVTLL